MRNETAYAPGRVELLGNHTDYNAGVVLAAAIDRGITMRGSSRADDVITLTSAGTVEARLSALRPLAGRQRWANYSLGVVREFLSRGWAVGGFDAEISSDLPPGAGLASSAALGVATAGLLMKLHDLRCDPLEVAKLCRRAENEFAGVQSGLLDQVTSVCGRADHLVFLDCRHEEIRTVAFPPEFALVIADSGVKHQLMAGQYNERRKECAAAAKALGVESLREATHEQLESARDSLGEVLFRRATHVVCENQRVWRAIEALRNGDARAVGELMNESHESSRTNFENSTRELDALVEAARQTPGVLGSRLTGGGFGGGTVTLTTRARAEAVAQRLMDRGAVAAFVCRITDGAAVHWQ